MIAEHLTDELIQDYLDRNLTPVESRQVQQHLEFCSECKIELAQYQQLYSGLKTDAAFPLSFAFSAAVMKKIRAEANKARLNRWLNILLPIAVMAATGGMLIRYVNFMPYVQVLSRSLNPTRYFDNAILLQFNQTLAKFKVNFELIVLAGLSFLMVLVIDQIISRHKDKFNSYLKVLPVF